MPRTLCAQHDRFALSSPFRISRGVKTVADVITVSIAEGADTGYGEGVPYARYGETIDSTLTAIAGVREAIEHGADRAALAELLPPGSARNALDCALWDLEAKQSGQPVSARIGHAPPDPVASALTIVIDRPDAMAAAAAKLARVPLLKVKVDANDPAAAIRAVRAAAPEPRLIVDPNESWDEALLRDIEPLLVELRVDLLEQPVAADADDWLVAFRPRIPICADEAVHVAADLDRVAARYQVVNVKLDKTGGLTEALALAKAARARGLGLMTGCMVSTSLSIAPALHIAARSDFVDLDGPIWLREDRPGGVADRDGTLYPPRAGFWGTG